MYGKTFFFLISFFTISAQLYCMDNMPSSDFSINNQLLINAVQNNNFLEVENLLKQGANSNIQDKDIPLLHIACKNENIPIVETLLNNGADVNTIDKDEKTVLFQVVNISDNDIKQKLLKLLIDKKININQKDKKKNVALSQACLTGHFKTVKFLIQNGAKADKVCLQYAHQSSCKEIYPLCMNNLFIDVKKEHQESMAVTIIFMVAVFIYGVMQYIP